MADEQETKEEVAKVEEVVAEEEVNESAKTTEGFLINTSDDNELKLFFGNLYKGTESSHLREYFSAFGSVLDAVVIKDFHTKKSKKFGFVLFESADVVKKVLASGPHKVMNKIINVGK